MLASRVNDSKDLRERAAGQGADLLEKRGWDDGAAYRLLPWPMSARLQRAHKAIVDGT